MPWFYILVLSLSHWLIVWHEVLRSATLVFQFTRSQAYTHSKSTERTRKHLIVTSNKSVRKVGRKCADRPTVIHSNVERRRWKDVSRTQLLKHICEIEPVFPLILINLTFLESQYVSDHRSVILMGLYGELIHCLCVLSASRQRSIYSIFHQTRECGSIPTDV